MTGKDESVQLCIPLTQPQWTQDAHVVSENLMFTTLYKYRWDGTQLALIKCSDFFHRPNKKSIYKKEEFCAGPTDCTDRGFDGENSSLGFNLFGEEHATS